MNAHRRGLTLIELLVSVTVCLALATLATVTFLKVRAILRREAARLEMHNDARFIYQAMREQFSSLQQDAASYVESRTTTTVPAGSKVLPQPAGVDVIFLKGKVDERDFTTGIGMGAYVNECVDLVWCIWRFDATRHTLCTGVSSGPHDWVCNVSWPGPKGDYNGHRFRNMPQPRRAAGINAAMTLDDNCYNTGDQRDIGDYTDLTTTLARVTRNMTDFTIEFVCGDGSTFTADSSQSVEHAIDGDFVDGHWDPLISSPQRRRPRLARIRFDLTDPVLAFTQTFSFSFQLPGALPTIYPTP